MAYMQDKMKIANGVTMDRIIHYYTVSGDGEDKVMAITIVM